MERSKEEDIAWITRMAELEDGCDIGVGGSRSLAEALSKCCPPPAHTCTKDDPWNSAKSDRAVHPDAVWERDQDMGDYSVAVYNCPHCALRFKVELPE